MDSIDRPSPGIQAEPTRSSLQDSKLFFEIPVTTLIPGQPLDFDIFARIGGQPIIIHDGGTSYTRAQQSNLLLGGADERLHRTP